MAEVGGGEKGGSRLNPHTLVFSRQHTSISPGGEPYATVLRVIYFSVIPKDALARVQTMHDYIAQHGATEKLDLAIVQGERGVGWQRFGR